MAAAPYPLYLSVSRDAKGALIQMKDPTLRQADDDYLTAHKAALARDRQACRGCGYAHGLELEFLDGDTGNLKLDNVLSLCRWCRWTGHVEFAVKNQLAIFIMHPLWPKADLPPQADIFMLARAALYGPPAQGLDDRRVRITEFLSINCANTCRDWFQQESKIVAMFLQRQRREHYQKRYGAFRSDGVRGYLDGVRLLPYLDNQDEVREGPAAIYWEKELKDREVERKEFVRTVGLDWSRYALKVA